MQFSPDLSERVVSAAQNYLDAPFRRLRPSECMKVQEGTGPEGFDCSGFVVRSICDALEVSVADSWSAPYRTTKGLTSAIYGVTAYYEKLDPHAVSAGDVIAWIEDGEPGHCAVATGSANERNELPYIHATVGFDNVTGSVRCDILRPNGWQLPIHIPLRALIERVFG